MMKILSSMILAGFVLSAVSGWIVAEEEPKPEVAYKEIAGPVAAVWPQGISVEYFNQERTSKEIALPVTSETRLERIKSHRDLRPGDTVSVRYQLTYRYDSKGKKVILNTIASNIRLIKPAQAVQEETLVSKEGQE